MAKKVLAVGNCAADQAALRRVIEDNFDAALAQADTAEEALAEVRRGGIDLLLVNRKLDLDQSDGLDVIRAVKTSPELAATPCMLITNFADHQQLAVEAGAEPGFGKSQLHAPQTRDVLARLLEG